MQKRVTFSFSLDASALGALIVQHSDNMNIDVFHDPNGGRKKRQPQLNGPAAPALAGLLSGPATKPSKGGFNREDIARRVIVMIKQAGGSMRGKTIIDQVSGAIGGGRSAVADTLAELVDKQVLTKPKNGTFDIAQTNGHGHGHAANPKRTKNGDGRAGVDIIIDALSIKPERPHDMQKLYLAEGRGAHSIYEDLKRLKAAKRIVKDEETGLYDLVREKK